MERKLVYISHPSGVKFNVHLTTYELNRAQTDPAFFAEIMNKYYSLYQKGIIFGAAEKDKDISDNSGFDRGPSTSALTNDSSNNTDSDNEIIFSEEYNNSESPLESVGNEKDEGKSLKLWSDEATLLLINLVKKYNEDLERGIKKYVWKKISSEIFQELSKQYTITQIETKWKGLVKHYKDLLRFNNTSGNCRKEWKYYNSIHEILYKKPEINPVAVCDSHSGLQIKTKDGIVLSTKATDISENEKSESEFESSFSQKRKYKECGVSKRHSEKMQRLDKLQGTLDRMVDLMAAKFARDNSE